MRIFLVIFFSFLSGYLTCNAYRTWVGRRQAKEILANWTQACREHLAEVDRQNK